jgi:hypothetical protein
MAAVTKRHACNGPTDGPPTKVATRNAQNSLRSYRSPRAPVAQWSTGPSGGPKSVGLSSRRSPVRIWSGAFLRTSLREPNLALGLRSRHVDPPPSRRSGEVSGGHEKSPLGRFRSLHGPFDADTSRRRLSVECAVSNLAEQKLKLLAVSLAYAVLVRNEENDAGPTVVPRRSVSDTRHRPELRQDREP